MALFLKRPSTPDLVVGRVRGRSPSTPNLALSRSSSRASSFRRKSSAKYGRAQDRSSVASIGELSTRSNLTDSSLTIPIIINDDDDDDDFVVDNSFLAPRIMPNKEEGGSPPTEKAVRINMEPEIRRSFRPPEYEEEEDETPNKTASLAIKLKEYYDRFGLRHIIPVILLSVYTLVGGAIFYALEHKVDLETQARKIEEIEDLKNMVVRRFEELWQDPLLNYRTRLDYARLAVEWYGDQLNATRPQTLWNYAGALFYAGTIYTTIGYGNISPRTMGGKVATMIYAIFGIPLVLAILSDLGGLLCIHLTVNWAKLKYLMSGVYGRSRKFLKQRTDNGILKTSAGDLEKNHTSMSPDLSEISSEGEVSIPALPALLLAIFWLVAISAFFLLWEADWNFFDSFYFFFISLTTIGLGDVVPADPQYLIANFWLIFLGLILISMVLNVIQQKMEEYLYQLMLKIQEEYQNLLEQEGEVTEDDKGRLLNEVWAKQPWFARNVMPNLLGNKQQQAVEDAVEQTIVQGLGTTCTWVQTDDRTMYSSCQGQQTSNNNMMTTSTVASETDSSIFAYEGMDVPLLKKENEQGLNDYTNVMPQSFPDYCDSCVQTEEMDVEEDAMTLKSASLQTSPIPCIMVTSDNQTDLISLMESGSQAVPIPLINMDSCVGSGTSLQDLFRREEDCQTELAGVTQDLHYVPVRRSSGVGDESAIRNETDQGTATDHFLGCSLSISNNTQTQTERYTTKAGYSQTPDVVTKSESFQVGNPLVRLQVKHSQTEQSPEPPEMDSKETEICSELLSNAIAKETQTSQRLRILLNGREFSFDDSDGDDELFLDSEESLSPTSEGLTTENSLPIIFEDSEGEGDEIPDSEGSWVPYMDAETGSSDLDGNETDHLHVDDGTGAMCSDSGFDTDIATHQTVERGAGDDSPALLTTRFNTTQTIPIESRNCSAQTALTRDRSESRRLRRLSHFFNRPRSDCSYYSIDQAMQTEIVFPEGSVSVEVQTIVSFLKQARRLDILARNRAQSLRVMAAPISRKGSKALEQMGANAATSSGKQEKR